MLEMDGEDKEKQNERRNEKGKKEKMEIRVNKSIN